MSSINSRVIPEFIGVLYCFICCKVSSPTSPNCYSFDKQLSGSLQFLEGSTDSPPQTALTFSEAWDSRWVCSLEFLSQFFLFSRLHSTWSIAPKLCQRNGSLVQSLKENFFFSLLHLRGILRIRNLKMQNIGALMKLGYHLLKWFTSRCPAHGHWWLSSMLCATQEEWLQPEFPVREGGQIDSSHTHRGLSQWGSAFPATAFMLVSVRLHTGRTLIPGPNRWVQPEELPFNLIYFRRVPLWNRCGKLPIYSTTPLLTSEKNPKS